VPATIDPTAADGSDQASSTADRLLAGAADLFRRKGYAATTTRELSALLGIQNASLYYHMEKKEDLLYKLCVSTLDDVANELRACIAETSDPLEQLKLIMFRYTTVALRDRDRHATMLIEIRALSDARRNKIVELRDKNVAVVRRTMAAAQKAGQLRSDIKPKYLVLTMFNLLNWSIFWYRPDGELTPETIAGMMSSVFLDGAAAEAKSSRTKSIASKTVRP
jgi:AcrR family transcriptional regulator